MRWWPDTLVGRTVLVILIGVVASNLVGLVLYRGDRIAALDDRAGRVAERITTAARLLDGAPLPTRRQLLRHVRGPAFRASWATAPWTEDGPGDWRIRLFRGALVDALGDDADSRLRLAVAGGDRAIALLRPPRRGRGGPGAAGNAAVEAPPPWAGRVEALIGSWRLADGSWLNFAIPLLAFRPFWMTPVAILVLATTGVVVVVSVWAVRRASQPLSMLAGAAERLGLDTGAPPVSEAGPLEVRRAAQAFNRMQQRLGALVRDRTQMLAAISHDLRTPITRLKLRAEWIDDPEQQAKVLADLDEMEAMIAATLSFARDDPAHEPRKALDLAHLLRTICDEVIDAGGEADYSGPDRATIVGRPLALKRAFSNLIGNAVAYGTRAMVVLDGTEDSAHIFIDDDGPGIPESELETVFEPFRRLEASRSRETGGVGLGLAVVRAVVGAHGGRVTLVNRPAGGLRAEVMLPTAPEHDAPDR